jgi:CRP-like cAMP-binding protein
VAVSVDGERVATLGAGEIFGEIGAVAWDGGYARPRSATVVAQTDVELDVIAAEPLRAALDANPRLEDLLRRVAGRRLRTTR